MNMATDSIVAEVRHARDTLAKQFHYDLRAMVEDARARQAVGTWKTVSFPSRTPGNEQRVESRGGAMG
jgi:hypothetical protein